MIEPLYLGLIGSALILVAFTLDILRKISRDDHIYLWMNIIGSGILVYYAYVTNTIPFMILNAVWTLFSFIGLFKKK